MHIYVVVPVHNRRSLTRAFLTSLHRQAGQAFSTILVDDGSTDGTSTMVTTEFPHVKVLQGDGTLWWVGSINTGIRHALAMCAPDDYILVINDDLVVKPNYLRSLADAAQRLSGAIIGSVETTASRVDVIKYGGDEVDWATAKRRPLNRNCRLRDFPPGHVVPVDKLTGRGTLFPSSIFREIGLYDERHFRQCGDTELPARAHLKHGVPLFVCYDSVVISADAAKLDINTRPTYRLAHLPEYLFGIRSHFNLVDRFWFAHNVAPNRIWFVRYLLLEWLRTIGHFVLRLRFGAQASSDAPQR